MSRRRATRAVAVAAVALAMPASADAHGLVGRADLPIPEWMFGWAAAAVLVISFFGLAVLWPSPRLEHAEPRTLFTIPRAVEVACGALGVAAFGLLVYVGLAGSQTPTANVLPTTVYVLLWVGLVPLSALLGDVFSLFNPWRAVGRGAGWTLKRIGGSSVPPPLQYPERVGRWPAVAGLVAFGWLELVPADGSAPRTLAIAAVVYFGLQLTAMSFWGADTWIRRGDFLAVYFGFFARLAPVSIEHGRVALRRPLSGLTGIQGLPGTVAFVCAAIGITAFDGAAEGPLWNSVTRVLQDAFTALGFSLATALSLALTVGLVIFVVLINLIYRAGVGGIRQVARDRAAGELARTFAHSLIPIALAYVLAHYFSLLVFQGQAVGYLVSDPLGNGSDLFGTAGSAIDYSVLSATSIWWVQVVALVSGHALALAAGHDRALATFSDGRVAVRSQYWMLAVMVAFTSLGLWLLSEANG